MTDTASRSPLLALPTEIRLQIAEYVLTQQAFTEFVLASHARSVEHPPVLLVKSNYSAASHLSILLVCRQFNHDFKTLAYRLTTFVVNNMKSNLSSLLVPIRQHIENLRKITLLADDACFRHVVQWHKFPFNIEQLRLDRVTIALHETVRSVLLNSFLIELVALLRRLENVRALAFMQNTWPRNGFRRWYNRLIGLMLKEDHHQRYDAPNSPDIGKTWWEWGDFDHLKGCFELHPILPRPMVPELAYMENIAPLVGRLMLDIEREDEYLDARA